LLRGCLVGAPVFVFELVHGFGFIDAFVAIVRHPVAIVVGVGAAVRVFEAVRILGILRALVFRIGHAIVVGVGDVGTAVFVLVAVLGFCLERTRVALVPNAILVVVRLRAAIGVLESIGILRFS